MQKVGIVLVFLMALLQGFYALFAYIDPMSFSNVRGTILASPDDLDWIQIYASRTLFISMMISLLLYLKNYKVLLWAALFGTVMPITDAWLAYQADSAFNVVGKHLATIVYLLIAAFIMFRIGTRESSKPS